MEVALQFDPHVDKAVRQVSRGRCLMVHCFLYGYFCSGVLCQIGNVETCCRFWVMLFKLHALSCPFPPVEYLFINLLYSSHTAQVFGHKLLAKDLDTAARYSKECDLDALTRDGDQVNRKGAQFRVFLCTFLFFFVFCVRFCNTGDSMHVVSCHTKSF